MIFDKIKYIKIKNTIKMNPHIGRKDKDDVFLYKQGKFALKYRIISPKIKRGREGIELVSTKTKLLLYERRFIRFKKGISNFFIYHEWLPFFKPKVFFPLILLILISYFVLAEPQSHKDYRARWILSRLLRLDIKDVEIRPGGWVKISGKRRTFVDHQIEPISYNVNLFRWLTFQDEGYITRWRGREYGYVDYPLRYDDQGNIQLKKEGKWIQGAIYKAGLEWQEPQGTGIREGKVLGHPPDLKGGFLADDQ